MSATAAEQPPTTTASGDAFRLEIDGLEAILWFDLPGEKVLSCEAVVIEKSTGSIARYSFN